MTFTNTSSTKQLAKEAKDFELQQSLQDTQLNLSDYLTAIKVVVKEVFNHTVWVKAEIRNLSSKSGHYYFELAEKDDKGHVIASCKATLWRYQAQSILKKFAEVTGQPLSRDLTVLLKVQATFHPQYGFSLNIEDIDAHFTLGELAHQYQKIKERLYEEGLLETNSSLPQPFDIEHVIVIAPEKAAGLGDFQAEANILEKTGACQFYYHHATFQGNHAPEQIRHAIIHAMQSFQQQKQRLPDLMVIIRGGGAVGDLAYLNDYELAALVAEQPIAVWVGIGHERDRVILDEVAHTSFDTPSKVINAIFRHLANVTSKAHQYFQTIEQLSHQHFLFAKNNCQSLMANIQHQSQYQINHYQQSCQHKVNMICHFTQQQQNQAKQHSQQKLATILSNATVQLKQQQLSLKNTIQTIVQASYQQLTIAQKNCQQYRNLIILQNPQNLLQQGYLIAKDIHTGQIIRQSAQLSPQSVITLQLQDGQAIAKIESVLPNPSKK